MLLRSWGEVEDPRSLLSGLGMSSDGVAGQNGLTVAISVSGILGSGILAWW